MEGFWRETKALAMPRDDGLRLDDGHHRAPVLPNARQDDPQITIGRRQARSWGGPFVDIEPLAEGEILQFQCDAGAEG
jgi:hypothetical protein